MTQPLQNSPLTKKQSPNKNKVRTGKHKNMTNRNDLAASKRIYIKRKLALKNHSLYISIWPRGENKKKTQQNNEFTRV